MKRVRVRWGETHAVSYALKISNDGKDWHTLREVPNGTGATEELEFPPVKARFLRIVGKKGTKGISAYSIREIEVFGE
jgi:hypothetical protein